MKISFFGETNVGQRRDHNEDSFLILKESEENGKWEEVYDLETNLEKTKGLFIVVADGMGGANAGEVASEIAVETIRQSLNKKKEFPTNDKEIQTFLEDLLLEAHTNITRDAKNDESKKGMGTTMNLAWLFNNTLFVVWSGDSRCYVYNKSKNKELVPFTDDHSLVWERVKMGELTPEQARLSDQSNLIMQALGDPKHKPRPDFGWIRLKKGMQLVFCSDGLNSMLSDTAIQQILDNEEATTKETCQELIQAANNAGGHDNVTTVVVEILETSEIVIKHKKKLNKKKIIILSIIALIACLFSILYFLNINNFATSFNSKISGAWDIVTNTEKEEIKATHINSGGIELPEIVSAQEQESLEKTIVETPKVKTKPKTIEKEPEIVVPELTEAEKQNIENRLHIFVGKLLKLEKKLNYVVNADNSFYENNKATIDKYKKRSNTLHDSIGKYSQIKILSVDDYKIRDISDYGHIKNLLDNFELQVDTMTIVYKKLSLTAISNE